MGIEAGLRLRLEVNATPYAKAKIRPTKIKYMKHYKTATLMAKSKSIVFLFANLLKYWFKNYILCWSTL